MSKILLLTMGGTIDAERYSEIEGEYPPNATMGDFIPSVNFLRSVVGADNLDWQMICHKDSKEITPEDEQNLLETIKEAEGYERIIITTGTDRMTNMAREIKRQIDPIFCPIVFTGAIWPLANGPQSDGWSNLDKSALTKIEKTDVYIAMGNVFIPAEYAEKDFKARKFVDLRLKGST